MARRSASFLKGEEQVRFLDRTHLKEWVDFLNETKFPDLPGIDNSWFDAVVNCIEVARIHPRSKVDIFYAGASIFYKVIKNHYRIDGNKRSGIIVLYLFFLRNDLQIEFSRKWVIRLAEAVASSIGGDSEEVIEEIARQFQSKANNGGLISRVIDRDLRL